MSTVNRVILIANLGRDPELRHTHGGQPVCTLNCATSRTWKDKNGEKQEETEWHRVTVWGKQAESCERYLSKGRQVYVEGRLKTSKYTDKDGVEKYSTEVVAERVQFLGGKGGGGRRDGGPDPYSPHDPEYTPATGDGDIPF